MRCLVFLFWFFPLIGLTAQKEPLTYKVASTWPTFRAQNVSNNGKYLIYSMYTEEGGLTWIVQSMKRSWKVEFKNVRGTVLFSANSRRLMFLNSNDSLCIFDLLHRSSTYVKGVSSFKVPSKGQTAWVAYLLKDHRFTLLNLANDTIKSVANVNGYDFDEGGNALVVQTDSIGSSLLIYFDLLNGSTHVISQNAVPRHFVFDPYGKKVAFYEKWMNNSKMRTLVKYYAVGMDSALTLLDLSTIGHGEINIDAYLNGMTFNRRGDRLLLRFRMGTKKLKDGGSQAHPDQPIIRSYKDYNVDRGNEQIFIAVANVSKPDSVVKISEEGDFENTGFPNWDNAGDNYLLSKNGIDEKHIDWSLVSTKDGHKIGIINNLNAELVEFSVSGKYLIWYDKTVNHWFTYRLRDHKIRNISQRIPYRLYLEQDEPQDLPGNPEGVAGWLKGDDAVLIYDNFDIWMVDPDGVRSPENITKYFGRRNSIRLRYLDFSRQVPEYLTSRGTSPIKFGDSLLLYAFNINDKTSGFFSLSICANNSFKLKRLTMSKENYLAPTRYSLPSIPGTVIPQFPLKATYRDIFVVQGTNTADFPNLYCTSDFKEFQPLTNFEPQRKYNWYSSELIHWKTDNGLSMEGILYKPEDFDSSKTYPIIFYYYERNADFLNYFVSPVLSNGALNVAWFVSNGYLIFVPDIVCYKIGYPGECAYQEVISAARYLSKRNWINPRKMGLLGHSYGGWETNYIITRSHQFSAAVAASGVSDLVSEQAMESTTSRSKYFKESQGRIGYSLWQRPALYIKNSPVYFADNVTTPLLIMHNKDDYAVFFSQEEEWFNELASLGKKVWLISYPHGLHTISKEEDRLDFSIRLAQFYGYYLKGAPPPKWMTMGPLAGRNGQDGLELDRSGGVALPCPLDKN